MEDAKQKHDGTLKPLDELLRNAHPLRFKKLHPLAELPTYAKPGDAGLDLVAVSKAYNHRLAFWEFGTGLAVEIPDGFVGLIFPRSSISTTPLSLCNSVGVIDSGYRGEIKLRFCENIKRDEFDIFTEESVIIDRSNDKHYEIGDRIGQLIILQLPSFYTEFVDELSDSERGAGGFGSSGY